MLHILERNYKQSVASAKREFPYCMLLLRKEGISKEGYLLAVSDSISSDKEFDEYIGTQRGVGILCVAGFYKEDIFDDIDY